MLPTAPTLKAATGMSSNTTRAWSATQSASITCISSIRAVSPIKMAVIMDKPWHPIADETEAYYASMDFDIGLCPVLETDFAKSKSNIKAVEYGARGIPVIASDVTCYRNYVTHGYNGFLARTEHEWLKYLHELANDEDLRRYMGENNFKASTSYRMSDRYRLWEVAYQSMYKERV